MRRKAVLSTQHWQAHTWKELCHLQQTSAFLPSILFSFLNEHAGLKSSHNSAYSWKPCPKDTQGKQKAAALAQHFVLHSRPLGGTPEGQVQPARAISSCQELHRVYFSTLLKILSSEHENIPAAREHFSWSLSEQAGASTGWATHATPGRSQTAVTPRMTKMELLSDWKMVKTHRQLYLEPAVQKHQGQECWAGLCAEQLWDRAQGVPG